MKLGSGKGAAAGKSGTMACRDGAGGDSAETRAESSPSGIPGSVLTRVLVLRGNGPASQDGECYRNDHHLPEWNSRHAHSPAAICKSAHDVRSNGAVAAHATHKFLSEAGSHLKARRHDGHYLIRHCDSPYGVRVKIPAGFTETETSDSLMTALGHWRTSVGASAMSAPPR
jgi:hypothetical protein